MRKDHRSKGDEAHDDEGEQDRVVGDAGKEHALTIPMGREYKPSDANRSEDSIYLRRGDLKRALFAAWEYLEQEQQDQMKREHPDEALICMVNSMRYTRYLAEET